MPLRLTPRPWDALGWLAALTTSLFVYSFFGAVEIAEFPPLPAKAPAATDETKVVLPDRAAGRAAGLGTMPEEEHRLPHKRVVPELDLRSSQLDVATVAPAKAARPHTAAGTRPARPGDVALPPEPAPEPPLEPPSAPPPASPSPQGEAPPAPMLPTTQVPAVAPLPQPPEIDDPDDRPKEKTPKRRDREHPPSQAQSDQRPPAEAPVAPAPPAPPAAENPPAEAPAEPGEPSPAGKHADKEEKGG